MQASPAKIISSPTTFSPTFNKSLKIWAKIQNFDLTNRCAHTATIFSHYIVIFGGFDGIRVLNDVIIFDLDTFAWKRAQISGNSPRPRYGHSACLYQENKLVIFGGHDGVNTLNNTQIITLEQDDQENFVAYCEEINHERGQDNLFRFYHSAHVVDKCMYLFGGKDQDRISSNQLWRLNLETFKWTQCLSSGLTEEFPDSRSRHGSLIYEGKMYIFGGECDQKVLNLNDLWTLDLESYKWSRLKYKGDVVPAERKGMSFIELNGQFYVFGGVSDTMSYADLYSFDPESDSWSQIGTKNEGPSGRADHSCVGYNNELTIIGGRNQRMYYFNDIYHMLLNDGNHLMESFTRIENKKNKKGMIWNERGAVFKDFLDNKAYSDITIKVGSEKYDCHKLALGSQCRYFENMFKSGMYESQSKVLNIPDLKETTFTSFLEYMYGHEIELNERLAIELFELADQWSLMNLLQECKRFLIENLSVDNFCEMSVLAEKFWTSKLMDAVIEFGVKNLAELEKREDLYKVPQCILARTVFKMRPQFN